MNYLEEAGNWLGLPSESPINESSINFFSAYTARKLKIGTNVSKFVTNYHKMDNDTIKGLESTIKLAKKQIKELEIEQEKFVNSNEKYKEKLIKKFKKYNPNKTWNDNNIKKYYKNEIEFNNKIINKCEKELKYIQVNNESYIEESYTPERGEETVNYLEEAGNWLGLPSDTSLNQEDYGQYIIGKNNRYAENYYNNFKVYRPSFNIPAYINIQELERIASEKADSLYKHNAKDNNRNYPFKFYNILYKEENLSDKVYKDIKRRTDSIYVKTYQYNFTNNRNKRISIIIITCKNSIVSAYILMNNDNLISINIKKLNESYIEEECMLENMIEYINEEKVFGVKIDKNQLNDEKYVRSLIKEINKASKEKKDNKLVDKILSILIIISLLSIVGIPVAILLSFLTLTLSKIRYDINTKDLKKIDDYLEKSIKKLKEAEAKAEGKDKKEYQKNIEKIEKNRKYIHDKVNVNGSTKRKIYGELLTEEEVKKLYNLIKKDLSPILDNYNKTKKDEIRKVIDDYLVDVLGEEDKRDPDEVEWYKDDFGQYYSKNVPTLKCVEYYSHDNDIAITLFKVGSRYLSECLNGVTREIAKDFKQKTKLSDILIDIHEDYIGQLWIKYDVLKTKEYLNSSIKESYTPERGEVKVNKINTLANLARNYGIENSGNLRDDIVSECTDILDCLDTVDESVIIRDISLLPVYKINEECINESYVEESTEIINESLSGDYEGVMGYNISFIQRKLFPISWLKRSKQSLEKMLDKYETNLKEFKKMSAEEQEKYCFKINAANAARSAAIAVGTTAVSSYASDGRYSLTYIEIPSKITPYNYPTIVDKMIKKLKYDINKLDDLIKQKEKAKGIREGYAIDLDSLKYVVESKECTLEEAIQEVRDVNYIGDTIPMYCTLPKNINENMTLESFITLNDSLNEAGIIPVSTREFQAEEFVNEGLAIETWNEQKVRKTLDTYEKNLEEVKQKKEYFDTLSPGEQKKYCLNKAVKNVLIGAGLNMVTFFIGGAVYSQYTTMKGDNTILGPKNYKALLNNLITAYNSDIKRLKKRLKELESKK